MAADRPFPPSARRRGLARRSGLSAASPVLVGGIATAAAVVAVVSLGRAATDQLGRSLAAACRGEAAIAPSGAAEAALSIALPVLVAAAIAAAIAQVAQTRTVWLPRRRIEGAPVVPAARVRRAAIDVVSAAVIGGVVMAWLWLVAPRLAALPTLPLAAGAMIASGLAAIAVAWVALGALDALVRHAELAGALYMTAREKRDDDRLAAADPRWRRLRAGLARQPHALDATLVVLGDDIAVAISWDPVRRPVPLRTASGRGARVTQLLGLARRDRVPVHRDAALARALLGEGPVPQAHWPRLAELVAAVRRD